MAFRYWYELTAGVLTLIALLIIRENGFIVFVTIAALPIIMRIRNIKPDERDIFLSHKFYQTFLTGLVLILLAGGFIFHISFSDFANLSNLTIFISASIFMILISILKLFYYYKN